MANKIHYSCDLCRNSKRDFVTNYIFSTIVFAYKVLNTLTLTELQCEKIYRSAAKNKFSPSTHFATYTVEWGVAFLK